MVGGMSNLEDVQGYLDQMDCLDLEQEEYWRSIPARMSTVRESAGWKKKLLFFPVRIPEKLHALIGCCPVQFFTIRAAHVSITIFIRFELRTLIGRSF